MSDSNKATIKGYLDAIDYSGKNNWAVIKVDVKTFSGTEEGIPTGKVTCTGSLPPSCRDIGCELELCGTFKLNEKYNKKQLEFRSVKVISPASQRGIIRFLEKELDGVGPVLARQIYNLYGERTQEVIRNTPEVLAQDIRGITADRAKAISKSFKVASEHANLKQQLYSVNLTSYQIKSLFSFFGEQDNLVEHLKQGNIFRLTKLHGFGFKRVDDIARKIGVAKDNPFRITECIFYFINEKCNTEGHTCLSEREIVQECRQLLGIADTTVEEYLQKLVTKNKLFTLESFQEYMIQCAKTEGQAQEKK